MTINRVDTWKKLYAWITYMRPHFMYASHIYCNNKIAEEKLGNMILHTREFIRYYNKSIKQVYNLKKHVAHKEVNLLMGKFAAVLTIAKNFEDPNVDKIAIGCSLNRKHEKIAQILKFDPKWALKKDNIDAAIQKRNHGE